MNNHRWTDWYQSLTWQQKLRRELRIVGMPLLALAVLLVILGLLGWWL